MVKLIHPIAGALSFAVIALFWGSTIAVEVFGTAEQVVAVKTAIPFGLLVLVPAIAVAGGSGFQRAAGRRGGLLGAKAMRMRFIAFNGIALLVPSALLLAWKAQQGQFDTLFYVVQTIELLAGAANLVLIGANMRDGFRMTRASRRRAKPA